METYMVKPITRSNCHMPVQSNRGSVLLQSASLWGATVEVGSAHSSQGLHVAQPISSWVVCFSPSDDEMFCWEAAQFIKLNTVSGLLSLPAFTAIQCLFTSCKYDRLYVYLTVCLCACACVEVMAEVVSFCICMWGCICNFTLCVWDVQNNTCPYVGISVASHWKD